MTQKVNLQTVRTFSRRQMLGILAASGGVALLSACEAGKAGAGPAPTQSVQAFAGYSIFHETMVELPWTKIDQAAKAGAIVLLPVGIIEEHGPQLGLAPDLYATYNWCKMILPGLAARSIQALIAPPMYWGISPMVRMYAGTFSVREATMKGLLYDIYSCLRDWGFKYVFSFSNHGDTIHNQVYQETIQEAREKLGLGVYAVCPKGTQVSNPENAVFLGDVPVTKSMRAHLDFHAGAFETAEMVAFFPETVDTAVAKTLKPSTEFGPSGYWGDPASYDQIPTEEIRKWADDIAAATVEALAAFLKSRQG